MACTCPEARSAEFDDFQLAVVGALLIGSIPCVILVAFASSRAPGSLIHRAHALVLLASGLRSWVSALRPLSRT